MVRIGFIFTGSLKGWNGGINYYSSIVRIISETPNYKAVILCPPELKTVMINKFTGSEIHYYSFLSDAKLIGKMRKAILYITTVQIFINRILRKLKIDVISLNQLFPLNKKSPVPSFSWIPDFQSRHYPDLFPQRWKDIEDFNWKLIIQRSTLVTLSSFDSRKDLLDFFPNVTQEKTRVLHFCLPPVNNKLIYNEESLQKYSLTPYKYYVISNQFWSHKNHIVVAKALHYLVESQFNIDFKIIATGLAYDPRGMQTYNDLLSYIDIYQLKEYFIMTGNIPYADVQMLQKYSIAVIQPSLFEGWNTAVEESKLIGKKIILSKINVHIEQSPNNVCYFDPLNDKQLGEILINTAKNYIRKNEEILELIAFENQEVNWQTFSTNYLKLVDETLGYKGRS